MSATAKTVPDAAVRTEGLAKSFRRILALEDVSLDVPDGATHFLLGPNGSGKTTLIRLLSGALRPTRGTVRVLGEDPYRHPERIARKVGIAFEDHHLPPWASARTYLRFVARSRGLGPESIETAAERFALAEYWDREMGTYSAGMRKRVMLAQAWLGDPRLLVLDEPFSNLDPEGRALLAGLLRARASDGRTTLVSTHLAESLAPPTHLACLMNGRVEASGTVEELAERYHARSLALAVSDPARVVRVLLEKGVASVAVEGGRIVVRGGEASTERAMAALAAEGIAPAVSESSFDVWAIYRAVLSARDLDG